MEEMNKIGNLMISISSKENSIEKILFKIRGYQTYNLLKQK